MSLETLQSALAGFKATLAKKNAKYQECEKALEVLKMPIFVPDREPKSIDVEVLHPMSGSMEDGMSLQGFIQGCLECKEPLEGYKFSHDYCYHDLREIQIVKTETRLESPYEIDQRNQRDSSLHYNRAGYKLDKERERLEGVMSTIRRQSEGIKTQIQLREMDIVNYLILGGK